MPGVAAFERKNCPLGPGTLENRDRNQNFEVIKTLCLLLCITEALGQIFCMRDRKVALRNPGFP